MTRVMPRSRTRKTIALDPGEGHCGCPTPPPAAGPDEAGISSRPLDERRVRETIAGSTDSSGVVALYSHTALVRAMGLGPSARHVVPLIVQSLQDRGIIELTLPRGRTPGSLRVLDWARLVPGAETDLAARDHALGARTAGFGRARPPSVAARDQDLGARAQPHALPLGFEVQDLGWMDEGSNSSTPNGMASVSPLHAERLSTDAEVDQAVEVLLELCRNWNLPASILRPGYVVLGRLAPDELERLARRTCQRVRQFDGTKNKIRNPLGWAIERIKREEVEWWAAAPGAQAPAAVLDPVRPLSGEVQGPGRAAEPDRTAVPVHRPMLDRCLAIGARLATSGA